jgi:hypothetical protein
MLPKTLNNTNRITARDVDHSCTVPLRPGNVRPSDAVDRKWHRSGSVLEEVDKNTAYHEKHERTCSVDSVHWILPLIGWQFGVPILTPFTNTSIPSETCAKTKEERSESLAETAVADMCAYRRLHWLKLSQKALSKAYHLSPDAVILRVNQV